MTRVSRFNEGASHSVVLARDAASELGHRRISTEHLLLGLLAEREGLAAWTLNSLGIELDEMRDAILHFVSSGDRPIWGQMPFSPRATRVMELANVDVDGRQRSYIGTEHVLLALMKQLEADPENDVALRVLNEFHVTPAQISTGIPR